MFLSAASQLYRNRYPPAPNSTYGHMTPVLGYVDRAASLDVKIQLFDSLRGTRVGLEPLSCNTYAIRVNAGANILDEEGGRWMMFRRMWCIFIDLFLSSGLAHLDCSR